MNLKYCLWCKKLVEPGEEGDIIDGEVLCFECAVEERHE